MSTAVVTCSCAAFTDVVSSSVTVGAKLLCAAAIGGVVERWSEVIAVVGASKECATGGIAIISIRSFNTVLFEG